MQLAANEAVELNWRDARIIGAFHDKLTTSGVSEICGGAQFRRV
jgi:hypothetical protein